MDDPNRHSGTRVSPESPSDKAEEDRKTHRKRRPMSGDGDAHPAGIPGVTAGCARRLRAEPVVAQTESFVEGRRRRRGPPGV